MIKHPPVISYGPSAVLLHGSLGRHAVELLHFLPVLLHHFTSRFVMARKHPAQHHKVCPGSERLGHVTRTGTATVLGAQAELTLQLPGK